MTHVLDQEVYPLEKINFTFVTGTHRVAPSIVTLFGHICTVTTFKYVEGGPDRKAPEVV